ncbi:hypothetical protein ABZ397_30820 [Streptomyces sp. NPDC005876]|uniref:hypothetical protein n=1 Tax=Streptomyces sp. NPDC005876 TaxID=3157076 RepID=UPI003407BF7B
MHRLTAILSVGTLTAMGMAATLTPAHAADPENPIVVCEDANNEIDVDFTADTAHVDTSIYHGCVSADAPSIVYGEVQPSNGTATGSAALAGVSVPNWKVRWYNAQDGLVATTEIDINATYVGPLSNLMVGTMTSTSPLVSLTVGTASRACPTSTRCTYYNTAVAGSMPILNL